MAEICVIQTSIDSHEAAARLAEALVEEHLAACVQMMPQGESFYRWQGAMTHATEWLLVIKTDVRQRAAAVQRLKALHPYTLPEIIWTTCESTDAYASWVYEESGVVDD